MSEQTEMIAEAFAANLRRDLSPKDFAEMVRRNRTPEYAKGCCASQDFCDANMAMDEAFTEIIGRPLDFGSDDDTAVWNEAWEIARRKHIGSSQ
jgi:hypothetical protein